MARETLGNAFFSCSGDDLIDTGHGVIVDVEATCSIRLAEVGSTKTMLNSVKEKFDLHPERLIADTACSSCAMLSWLVDSKIAPRIPVIDETGRTDGIWSCTAFEWDAEYHQYICPAGEALSYSDATPPIPIVAGQERARPSAKRSYTLARHARRKPSVARTPMRAGSPEKNTEELPTSPALSLSPPIQGLGTAQEEGRDSHHPSQTHPRPGTAAITWDMRRKRRTPTRSSRPECPQAGEDLSRTAAIPQSLIRKTLAPLSDRNSLRSQHIVFQCNRLSVGVCRTRLYRAASNLAAIPTSGQKSRSEEEAAFKPRTS